jgi:hypothetical protein
VEEVGDVVIIERGLLVEAEDPVDIPPVGGDSVNKFLKITLNFRVISFYFPSFSYNRTLTVLINLSKY